MTLVRRVVAYDAVGSFTRVEPANTGVALILAYGDPLLVGYSPDRAAPIGAFVVGNHTRPAWTTYWGRQTGVEVNLTLAGACAVFGEAVHELTDEVVPVDAVLGRFGAELVARAAEGSIAPLLSGLSPRAEPGDDVRWVCSRLVATHGTARVEALVAETGWSERHFRRRFERQVGLPPKAYARLLRFEHGRDLLLAGVTPAEVAARGGWSDQSHLNRDFRGFAGCTPGRFVQDLAEEAVVPSPA